MYLKEIRTYGFKSFADKINIEFGKNLNGIVGPNGSGKSNVVDAVRWVLGEQSMKQLRGDSSADIIFSGSKTRKPLNSASVNLIFDNSNRELPLDYSEVSIKRIVYRSGENEYYINNERCRLKDITDLLTESGAAKESFNIISQGKIDEILSTKPIDRRVIIEEAAGVLKYKRRKEEALRKLERTNNNINRINDIISELETNLDPLRIQAEKAKEYKDTKDKLGDIELSLITSDIESLNSEYKESKEKIDKLNDEISSLSSNLSTYDIDILKEKEKLKVINDNISNSQNKLIDLNGKKDKLDTDLRLLKERIRYVDNDNTKNNIILLKEEEFKYKTDSNNITNEINILNKKLELINNDILINNNKNLLLKDKYNKLNNNYIKNNNDITNLKYKIDYLENSINNNNSLPKSVTNILNNPKFSGIHDIIGKLFEVENTYSLAIATSLGASSNYLVVDNSNIAKELVNYLKNNNLGRATFYPLDVISPRYIEREFIDKLSNINGFIDIASNLVNYSKKYDNIILNQLGNVIVASDIESANNISKIINKRYKIVTLDGQVVNVGGSITGGSNISNNIIKEKYELDNFNLELRKLENNNKLISDDINSVNKDIKSLEEILYNLNNEKLNLDNEINVKNKNITELNDLITKLDNEISQIDIISSNNTNSEEDKLLDSLFDIKKEINEENALLTKYKLDKEKLEINISELEDNSKSSNTYIANKEREVNSLNIKVNRIDVKLDNLLLSLTNDYNMTFENAKLKYKLEMDVDSARKLVNELKEKLNIIGIVNLGAEEEYDRIKTRYDFLTKQREDLSNAETTLFEIIKEMDDTMKNKFFETFNLVNKEFKIVFRELFKGGQAELILTDPNNLLETGVDIKAEPPGKKLQNISLLSGGERTFTAISLLFAILNIRTVPFCIFDEVEAALDDANVESFGSYLQRYKDNTQFIIITHKKKTMEYVDILYGITMQESGVSKLVSVKLDDVKR